MFGFIKFKKLVRILSVIALIPILAIGSVMYQSYNELEQAKLDTTHEINKIKDSEWNAVEMIMSENTSRACMQISLVRNNVQKELLAQYDDMRELKEDLSSSNMSKAHEIINNNISGIFMNINSDDNRIIVANKNRIIVDKSVVASIGKNSRTWETELNSKSNEILSEQSLNLIMTKQIKYTFEESLSYDKVEDSYTAIYPNTEYIRQDFLLNGLQSLKRYDILVPAYITDSGDIFGIPDVGSDGLRTDNDKIILIQKYNIYDAINMHHSCFENYEERIKSAKIDLEGKVSDIMLKMILNCIIMVLSFVGILFSVIVCISWSDEGDARSFRD